MLYVFGIPFSFCNDVEYVSVEVFRLNFCHLIKSLGYKVEHFQVVKA